MRPADWSSFSIDVHISRIPVEFETAPPPPPRPGVYFIL